MKNRVSKNRKTTRLATQYVVRVAFMSALLTALKFALSFVPNIEVVTLLILVFGACLGLAYTLPAVLIFCAVEMAIYGVGSWVILYFLYWPLLALVSSVLLKRKRVWIAILIAVVGSVLFGVMSACTDTLWVVSNLKPEQIGKYWTAYYLRGLTFDAIHCASNFVVVLVLFSPLAKICNRFAPQVVRSRNIPRNLRKYTEPYFREKQKNV